MITINMDVRTAAAIEQALFDGAKDTPMILNVYRHELLKFVM